MWWLVCQVEIQATVSPAVDVSRVLNLDLDELFNIGRSCWCNADFVRDGRRVRESEDENLKGEQN